MDLKIPKTISVVRRAIVNSDSVFIYGQETDGDNQKLKRYTDKIDRFKKNSGKSFLDVVDFENTPTSGYRLYTHQSTYKIETVQILSPLGFVTNISIANLFDLISSSVINNSRIEDELFYDDKMNLISVNSVGYKNLIKSAKKESQTKAAAAEVCIGDILVTKPNPKGEFKKYIYCGKYHVLSSKNNFPLSMKGASELLHVLRNQETLDFIVTRDIKTGTYDVSPAGLSVDRKTIIEQCNFQLRDINLTFCDRENFNHSYNTPLLFGDKKFKKEQTEYVFEEVSVDVALSGSNKYGRNYAFNINGIDRYVIMSSDDWKTVKCPLFVGKENTSRGYYNHSKYSWNTTTDDANLILSLDCAIDDNGHLSTFESHHETYKDSWRWAYDFDRAKHIHEWSMKPYSPQENKNYVSVCNMSDMKYKTGFLKLKDDKCSLLSMISSKL